MATSTNRLREKPETFETSGPFLVVFWLTSGIFTFNPTTADAARRSWMVTLEMLSIKTPALLWLHTSFKWTAPQNQQDYGDKDRGQNSGKFSKWVALCAL